MSRQFDVVVENFTLVCDQEDDGCWIAEVPELLGVLSYGNSAADAMSKAEILAHSCYRR